jgi:hypothetical protein
MIACVEGSKLRGRRLDLCLAVSVATDAVTFEPSVSARARSGGTANRSRGPPRPTMRTIGAPGATVEPGSRNRIATMPSNLALSTLSVR